MYRHVLTHSCFLPKWVCGMGLGGHTVGRYHVDPFAMMMIQNNEGMDDNYNERKKGNNSSDEENNCLLRHHSDR